MGVQSNVGVTLAYKVESTFGTAAGASGAQLLRRVSSSLAPQKDSFASREVRADRQISDLRHGGRSVRGSIEGELSTQSYDDFLEAALCGTWAAGVSVGPADFATGVTPANGTPTGTFTFAGAGSLITKGFKVGDIVRCTGMTVTANNGVNFRITALTATVMTVFPAPATGTQQAAGWAIAVQGKKLVQGLVERSFTIEQQLAAAAYSEQFTGTRVNGFQLGVQPNGMTSVTWDMLGQNFAVLTGGSTPYFSSPAAQANNGVCSGIDGALRLNGEEQGVVTALQLSITNNCSLTPVIGANYSPMIFYGNQVVTGSVSVYVEDADLLTAFVNESEVDLVAVLNAAGQAPQDFLSFRMTRVKFSGAQTTIGADGGVLAQMPFQGLLRTGGTGTVYDQSTLVIQRSNP